MILDIDAEIQQYFEIKVICISSVIKSRGIQCTLSMRFALVWENDVFCERGVKLILVSSNLSYDFFLNIFFIIYI